MMFPDSNDSQVARDYVKRRKFCVRVKGGANGTVPEKRGHDSA